MADIFEQCPKCGSSDISGCEYTYDHPEHYDGISEWHCLSCGCRVGRWSGKILTGTETEPPFGGERNKL